MSEQWFLDLDGVRSGPYQTSEVMSLVAEGEILPHHLIGTELKSQKWMTILEWRLNQNRNLDTRKESSPPSASAQPTFSPVQEKPISIEIPVVASKEEKQAWAAAAAVSVSAIPTPLPKKISSSTPPPDPIQESGAKRDPMAEMFDMLQNTKQKREVKSQQSHAQAHAQTQVSPAQSGSSYTQTTASEKNAESKDNWGKTVLVAIIITILGFVLGQLFQQQKGTEPPPSIPPKNSALPAPNHETGDQKTEVVDRSNNKITIKAQVPVSGATPEHGKEMQDLKDLKKELMELKALKEEIRGNGSEPGRIKNFDPPMPNPPDIPEPIDDSIDENGNSTNPPGDVHY